MNRVVRRRVTLGYVVVLVTFAAMVFLAFRNANDMIVNNRRVEASHALLAELDSTLSATGRSRDRTARLYHYGR